MTDARTRRITVDALARVEGEGALDVSIQGGLVRSVAFRIGEPARLFEAFLVGRQFSEVPDITARICGICPIAYMLSSSQAIENALGVAVSERVQRLRRLIYCGEWIASHVLHAAFLHAPDFLGMADAFALARRDPALIKTALALKGLGNRILEVVGGRAIHPVNLRLGGFYCAPAADAVRALCGPLREGMAQAMDLGSAFARFDFPDTEVDYTFVSLHDPAAYAVEQGRIVSNRGLDSAVAAFGCHFREEQVAHSTALHGLNVTGAPYLVGPLARYANNSGQLTTTARAFAAALKLGPVCRNPFKSILVRMVETVFACEEALHLCERYEPPAPLTEPIQPRAGEGHGATEAPRGLCYHHYRMDEGGRIAGARIVPPTAQNQRQIEADLGQVVAANLHLAPDALRWRCEQAIRNHDPCISCATHFLTVSIRQE
jgi:coenzyme F420-reducing hydrogenase alpha subunit